MLSPDQRRQRVMGLMALLFVAAQLLFAIHSDDLAAHAPQSCEYCLAAAISDDPNDLVVEIPAPLVSFDKAQAPVAQEIVIAGALRTSNPRAPPFA